MRTFRIGPFWKEQTHGSATRLPEREVEALTRFHATLEYIEAHKPWLGHADYALVREHVQEVNPAA